MEDTYTEDKMNWLDQVSGDVAAGNLTPRAFHLAFEIAQRMNREKRDAWPGQTYLEGRVGVSSRALRDLIEALKKRGHLDVQRGGWGKTSRYRWIIKPPTDRKPASGQDDKGNSPDRKPASDQQDTQCTPDRKPASDQGDRGKFLDRKFCSALTGSQLPPNPLREHFKEDREDIPPTPHEEDRRKSEAVSPTAADDPPASEKTPQEPDGFAAWWDQYPTGWQTHESARPDQERRRAERAWRALLRAGEDPRTLIAETMKFGQHVAEALDAGAEARFIAQPSNFLKGRKWETPERWPKAPANVVSMSGYRGGGGQRDEFDPVAWAAEFEAQSEAASNWWRT